MKAGSLFTGYGGLEKAIEHHFDIDLEWVCDIDPAANAVIDKRFPGVPNLGDVSQIKWGEVPPVEVIIGGSPCKDLSVIGKRKGMVEGTESNLWGAMRNAIEIHQPKLVVWENVLGAMSAKATSEMERGTGRVARGPFLRAIGRVLGDLSELGYNAEWQVIRASDVGAPHRRARVFLIAWPAGTLADTLRSRSSGRNAPSRQSEEEGPDFEAVLAGGAPHESGAAEGRRELAEYREALEHWEYVIGRPMPSPTIVSATGLHYLSPRFGEWMMGLPEGWVTDLPLTRKAAFRVLGGGVVPQQGARAIEMMIDRVTFKKKRARRAA